MRCVSHSREVSDSAGTAQSLVELSDPSPVRVLYVGTFGSWDQRRGRTCRADLVTLGP